MREPARGSELLPVLLNDRFWVCVPLAGGRLVHTWGQLQFRRKLPRRIRSLVYALLSGEKRPAELPIQQLQQRTDDYDLLSYLSGRKPLGAALPLRLSVPV